MEKKTAFFVLILALVLCSFTLCFAAQEAEWAMKQHDQRRSLPNDNRPPARLLPTTMLPPLSSSEIGVIRSVTPKNAEKLVALTFDLCELATSTSGCDMGCLAFLHEKRIPATLFVSGKWMRTHAKRMLQLMADPIFEFGNHAWSHGNCALLSSEGLRAQVLWTQAQYELLREELLRQNARAAAHLPPVPQFFRLPYARSNPKALAEIAALGLPVVLWDVVGERGPIDSVAQAKRTAAAVVRDCKPGSILLFHANLVPKGTALLLREVVALLEAQNYRFVSVGTLLGHGTAKRVSDGYFERPGDNIALDSKFGKDGTGSKEAFSPEPKQRAASPKPGM